MSALKLIAFLFPFVKEMVLGEKTIREALKTNKMRVLLIVLILLSFLFNILFIPRLLRISAEYVMLDKKYKVMEIQESPKPVIAPVKPIIKPTKPKEHHVVPVVVSEPTIVAPIPEPPKPDAPSPISTEPPTPKSRHTRRPRHLEPHQPINTPEETTRYLEWKKSFDEIKAQEEMQEDHDKYIEERNKYAPPAADGIYEHH